MHADTDGLLVEEKTALSFASKVHQIGVDGVDSPVMRACGHDTHIAAMIGTTKRLTAMKDCWSGSVPFHRSVRGGTCRWGRGNAQGGLYTRYEKPDCALAFQIAAQLPDRGGLGVGAHLTLVG